MAASNIGLLYENGDGVKKDYKKAAEMYSEAVEMGDASSYENLASLYETGGFGLKKDIRKAKEFRKKYADEVGVAAAEAVEAAAEAAE